MGEELPCLLLSTHVRVAASRRFVGKANHLSAAYQKPKKRPTQPGGLKESLEAENCTTALQATNTFPEGSKQGRQTPSATKCLLDKKHCRIQQIQLH